MLEGGFQFDKRRRRKKTSNRNTHNPEKGPSFKYQVDSSKEINETDPILKSIQKIMYVYILIATNIRGCSYILFRNSMRFSDFFKTICSLECIDLVKSSNEIVCLGLGPLSTTVSQYQLSLLVLLREMMGVCLWLPL